MTVRCSAEYRAYGDVHACIRAVGADGRHPGKHHAVTPYPDDAAGARLATWDRGGSWSSRVTDVAVCPECGTLYPSDREAGPTCWVCEWWYERLGLYAAGQVIVIGGTAYGRGQASGAFGNRPLHIVMDDGREFNDTRTWHLGDIPPHLIELFPDNARTVAADRMTTEHWLGLDTATESLKEQIA